jgi:hypothetical protein
MRHVSMYADQPSCIELHVQETVRIDQLHLTADGYIAAQHGALLAPGVTRVPLDQGIYHFRTLEDAQLRVIAGGVQVASTSTREKDPWFSLSPHANGAATSAVGEAVASRGQGPCGRVPAFHVVDATAAVR